MQSATVLGRVSMAENNDNVRILRGEGNQNQPVRLKYSVVEVIDCAVPMPGKSYSTSAWGH